MKKFLSAVIGTVMLCSGVGSFSAAAPAAAKGAATDFSLFQKHQMSQLALDSNEDFEIYAAGASALEAGFSALNQNAVAYVEELDGNKCVRLESIVDTAGVLTWATSRRLSGLVLLEYDVMIPYNLYYSQIPIVDGYTAEGEKVHVVSTYVTNPAKYLMIGMSSIGKIDLPLQTWIRMGYEINTVDNTVSVYIDGKQVADNEASFSVVETVSEMYFSVKTPGNILYLDNIKIGAKEVETEQAAYDARPARAFPKEIMAFTEQDKQEQRDAGSALIREVQAAYESGAPEIIVPDGYYRLYNPISLDGAENFEIKGNEVNIIMEKTGSALSLTDCKNVKVSGLRIDYDPLSFTQGVVTHVDKAAKKFAIKIDNGYPEPNAGWAWNRVIPYEPTGNIILPVQHNDRLTQAEPLGNKEYLISMSGDSFFADTVPLKPGCIIVIPNRKGDGAVRLSQTENCTLEHVYIYSSPGFALADIGGYGDNKYIDFKITVRPDTNRRLSSSADGFHTYDKVKGPTLDACEISHVEDDVMNLNTSCNYVFDVLGPRTIRVVANRILCAKVGEEMKIFDLDTMEIKEEATVAAVSAVSDSRYLEMVADVPAFTASEYNRNSNVLSTGTYSIYDVTLDRDVDALPFDILTSNSQACAGTVIKNSKFHHGFVRGISLRAPQTLIENCTFDTLCNAAIDMEMYQFWLEGPCATDVTIRSNTFTNCVYGAVLDTSLLAAVQTLTPRFATDGNKDPYDVQHYDNIQIYDNVFDGSRACAVALINASNSKVYNNRISHVFNNPFKEEHKLPNYMNLKGFYSAILAEYSANVTIENNEITDIPAWCVPVTNGSLQ